MQVFSVEGDDRVAKELLKVDYVQSSPFRYDRTWRG